MEGRKATEVGCESSDTRSEDRVKVNQRIYTDKETKDCNAVVLSGGCVVPLVGGRTITQLRMLSITVRKQTQSLRDAINRI